MQPFTKISLMAAVFALFLAPLAPAYAAPGGPPVIVDVRSLGDALQFEPLISYVEMQVIVDAGGCELVHTFARGKDIVVPLIDEQEMPLVDGQYAWEARAVPELDQRTLDEIAAAAEAGNRCIAKRLRLEGRLPSDPLVQSGYFMVDRGVAILPRDEPEDLTAPTEAIAATGDTGAEAIRVVRGGQQSGLRNVTAEDFVILDDLIVDGSACIGFDCVNGESFGFDTIRLKENNLRIKFQDTSTAASFPTRDWQLTANDSANGGASKFSIDDIDGGRTPFTVEANAPSHSLYVDDGGRLGFGTSTPVVELHVVDGDTPTLRLQQDGSSGFAPQTWDVAGNETSFFVRDATNGSTLPLRIRPGAPSNSLVIDTDGDVGIGTLTSNANLHVVGDSTEANIRFATTGASAQEWDFQVNSSGTFSFRDETNAITPFKILNNNTQANVLILSNDRVGILTGNNPAGTLDVNGSIYQRGAVLHADYVFEPDYELESIEDHAAFMWANKHLPAVTKKQVDEQGREVIEIGAHRRGMLEELEKAHIYIEQLHNNLQEVREESRQKDEAIASLENRLEDLTRTLEERLAQLEAAAQ